MSDSNAAETTAVRVTSAPMEPALDSIMCERGDTHVLILRDSLTIAQSLEHTAGILGPQRTRKMAAKAVG